MIFGDNAAARLMTPAQQDCVAKGGMLDPNGTCLMMVNTNPMIATDPMSTAGQVIGDKIGPMVWPEATPPKMISAGMPWWMVGLGVLGGGYMLLRKKR